MAFNSAVHQAKHRSGHEAPKHRDRIYGNTKISLPYILDMWCNTCSGQCISVQVQLLTGKDAYWQAFARVSTDQNELVLTMPMSKNLICSDFAFDTFLLADPQLSENDKHYMRILLKHHPKSAARMVAASKTKGRSNTEGHFYEQRIPLPRKCQHMQYTQ